MLVVKFSDLFSLCIYFQVLLWACCNTWSRIPECQHYEGLQTTSPLHKSAAYPEELTGVAGAAAVVVGQGRPESWLIGPHPIPTPAVLL